MKYSKTISPQSVRDILDEENNNGLPLIERSNNGPRDDPTVKNGALSEQSKTITKPYGIKKDNKKILPLKSMSKYQLPPQDDDRTIKPPLSPESTQRRGRFIVWPTADSAPIARSPGKRWRTMYIRRDRKKDCTA